LRIACLFLLVACVSSSCSKRPIFKKNETNVDVDTGTVAGNYDTETRFEIGPVKVITGLSHLIRENNYHDVFIHPSVRSIEDSTSIKITGCKDFDRCRNLLANAIIQKYDLTVRDTLIHIPRFELTVTDSLKFFALEHTANANNEIRQQVEQLCEDYYRFPEPQGISSSTVFTCFDSKEEAHLYFRFNNTEWNAIRASISNNLRLYYDEKYNVGMPELACPLIDFSLSLLIDTSFLQLYGFEAYQEYLFDNFGLSLEVYDFIDAKCKVIATKKL